MHHNLDKLNSSLFFSFEFFNMRKPERRVYESFPEGRHYLKLYSREESDVEPEQEFYPEKPLSPRSVKVRPCRISLKIIVHSG